MERLLAWFAVAARDLPWRRTRDPYGIWVSEIMLQQTQVKTVIPYWERWMKALPDVATLAAADEARVLKLWEGLGYYRRARHLHAAAREIVARHGGRFPSMPDEILALPGVGRYTAGAIGSIAFGLPMPILDGNVIRVLTRWMGWKGDPKGRELNAKLWAEAEALVRRAHGIGTTEACSHLNQALMELGATVCTPREPGCDQCPVAGDCAARKAGCPESFPETTKRATTTTRRFVVVVGRRGDRFAVEQRPSDGVNAGLWEFAAEEWQLEREVRTGDARSRARRWYGPISGPVEALGTVRHAITRYRITQHVFLAEVAEASSGERSSRWLSLEALEGLAFSSAHRRILGWLRDR